MNDGIGCGRAVTAADGSSPVQVVSTDQVAAHERHAYWKEAIFDAIANVDITCRDDDAFRGRVRWRGFSLGDREHVTLTEVAATPQTARRGALQVGREKEAFFGVTFQRKGAAAIDQGGRNDLLRPGDVWLLDGTQRSCIDLGEPFDQILLRIPHERLAPRLPRGDQWRGLVLRTASPLCAVLNAHVGAVESALARLEPDSRTALLETTIDLIALAFTEEIKSFAGDASTVRRALVLRAMRFIDARLADPALSAISVAAALGVSTGYLQHVFQATGTTAGGHIRRDSSAAATISSIRCAPASRSARSRWAGGSATCRTSAARSAASSALRRASTARWPRNGGRARRPRAHPGKRIPFARREGAAGRVPPEISFDNVL